MQGGNEHPIQLSIDAHGVATLTLNRPEVHNAFDDHLIAGLTTRLRELDHTPDVRYRRVWTMAEYQGRLFATTLPSGHVFSHTVGVLTTHDRELPPGWHHVAALRHGGQLKLFVDGKEIGPLPQELPDLTPGEHQVKIEGGDRYDVFEKPVSVSADQVTTLEPKLKVKKGLATIKPGLNADGAYCALSFVRSAVFAGTSSLPNSKAMSLNTARS